MKKKISLLLMVFALVQFASAHCEIPCGIYNDQMRIVLMKEHVTTIEKSMKSIVSLEKEKSSSNQLMRWVVNKEEHANMLQGIVTQYFMTQRIKPEQKKYAEKLAALHTILLLSMKAKQAVDLSVIAELHAAIGKFEKLYIGEEHKH